MKNQKKDEVKEEAKPVDEQLVEEMNEVKEKTENEVIEQSKEMDKPQDPSKLPVKTPKKTSPVKQIQRSVINTQSFLGKYKTVEAFAEVLFKSNFCPSHIKSVNDTVTAILRGRELGLEPVTALENIYLVNGKSALSVGIYTAKLLQNGIIFEILKDYEQLTQTVYKNREGSTFTEDQVLGRPANFQVVTGNTDKKLYDANKVQVQATTALGDIVTTIKFKRKIKILNEWKDYEMTHTIGWNECVVQGLTTKDNWQKMPRKMLKARCLCEGARLIAPELFLGMYSAPEIMDAEGVNYNYSDEGIGFVEDIEHEVVGD